MNVFQEQSILQMILIILATIGVIVLFNMLSWLKRIAIQIGCEGTTTINTITFTCPECNEKLEKEGNEKIGDKVTCPKCNKEIIIPEN